ncbi:LacI family DNA-binding transcriptional regulator [Alkalibacterium putridalgicola]|uniref:DNA-binding transcriptional regulator, LacI/PurR family n=1 Tax=Alkalibacterium putridalgicola TaxID=426703 RepID=A0A1H7UQQ9_9LACT|nr:LacI family DNA-binding transcriptional regulator [Alkalibacterium putridalgicola]GEK88520.1 LacI family transcriptional regulator [Alkalibacterium putridalgicola]SEL99119.1 DNA-binding transcriptional regulator, LacI/PurR family [Alkalibacterium putridalgicola]
MATTIQDIAKHAGVSSATVSRVINTSGYVGSETRRKVENAIRELNYAPNKHAQLLRTGETKNFGIVSTQFNETAVPRINSFIAAAHSAGYTTTLFITNGDQRREREAFDLLRAKELDGIFLIYRANDWEVLEKYLEDGPIVTLHNVDTPGIPSVFIDHYEGNQLALSYAWDTGCRRILNVYGTPTGLNTTRRIEAYLDFCASKDVESYPSDPFLRIFSADDVEHVVDWIEGQSPRPDAVIAHSDNIAALLVSRLQKRGFNIPEDLSIIGFDNLFVSEVMDMTTVDYGIEEQGRNACRSLLKQLGKASEGLTPLTFRLIKRGTTKDS